MPRLNADQWAEIRLRREMGESFPALAAAFGVSHTAISKRASKEGWGDGTDTNAIANRLAWDKVAGKVSGCNPAEKLQAVFDASTSKAEILERQQADWAMHREVYSVNDDLERLKEGKLSAEMLTHRHNGERKAHGLDEAAPESSIKVKLVGTE